MVVALGDALGESHHMDRLLDHPEAIMWMWIGESIERGARDEAHLSAAHHHPVDDLTGLRLGHPLGSELVGGDE